MKTINFTTNAFKLLKGMAGKFIQEIGGELERKGCQFSNDISYQAIYSRHRNVSYIDNVAPEINKTSILAENSTIVGDVIIQSFSNIGYNAVLRAEDSVIR